MAINPYLSYLLGGAPTTAMKTTSTQQAAPPPGGGYDDGRPPPADTAPAYTPPRTTTQTSYNTGGTQPFTTRSAASGGDTYAAYQARKAANPSYVPTKSGDMVGWIVENYGKEWLKPDGTAPDEAIWTYTGGENGGPKIGSVTGINYLPWNDKNLQYDPANGQDYSRPQYANGPDQLPTGGYQGTPEEIQADRDANNWFRNGGTAGMNPAMMASMQGAALRGTMRDSYTLPDGSTYNLGLGVSKQNPMGRNASYSGPGGSWSDNHWGKPMENGIWKGLYPGQSSMEALSRLDPAMKAYYESQGINMRPRNNNIFPKQAAPAYIGLPANHGQFGNSAPQTQRGPWMQEMDNSEAMAQQQAQVAALRGSNG